MDGGLNLFPNPQKNFPHLCVGDFDSIKLEKLNSYIREGGTCIKRDTQSISDLELALLSTTISSDHIALYGLLGKDRAHEWTNILLLYKYISNHSTVTTATFIMQNQAFVSVLKKDITHNINHTGRFSVLSLEDHSLTLQGQCKYPCQAYPVAKNSSNGLSNHASGAFTIHSTSTVILFFDHNEH